MERKAMSRIPHVLALILTLMCVSPAQRAAGPGISDSPSPQPIANRTIAFSGFVPGQPDGPLSVTFAIYPDQQSVAALWTETQVVQLTGEKYTTMLGSTSASGLPPEIFSADQDLKGRVTSGSQSNFSDLVGFATRARLRLHLWQGISGTRAACCSIVTMPPLRDLW
jgi:hypothetical protein